MTKSAQLIDTWKVLVPKAFNGGDAVPHQILGKPLIAPSPLSRTQSFLFFNVGSHKAAEESPVVLHDLVLPFPSFRCERLLKTQCTPFIVWVPMQTWNRTWTDEALYAKYGITRKEQAYIESQVRAMKLENGEDE